MFRNPLQAEKLAVEAEAEAQVEEVRGAARVAAELAKERSAHEASIAAKEAAAVLEEERATFRVTEAGLLVQVNKLSGEVEAARTKQRDAVAEARRLSEAVERGKVAREDLESRLTEALAEGHAMLQR